ncbi:hypothetical protein [Desulfosporosinus hippei]|uniref:Uncharacterized protein n=1 Tax=Desulfosporosinus hippei DSM 8344 TaxID=1121419 RepID=A0A1G7V9T2_9FIRM|nr:hypothetical protein [Desulfosporosinus hippei]SDG56572.1 hypothetical protein SAMN05443529_10458 [Desulfosporosinus hippei DSM 8344]
MANLDYSSQYHRIFKLDMPKEARAVSPAWQDVICNNGDTSLRLGIDFRLMGVVLWMKNIVG